MKLHDVSMKLQYTHAGYTLIGTYEIDDSHFRVRYNDDAEIISKEGDFPLFAEAADAGKKAIRLLSLIEEEINKGTLLFQNDHIRNNDSAYQCFFTINRIPEEQLLFYFEFHDEKYNHMNLRKSVMIFDHFALHVGVYDRKMMLMQNRVIRHLFKNSTHRMRFLMDSKYDRARNLVHDLKRGDRVYSRSCSFSGKKEAVVKRFFVSDEFTEMAVLDVDGVEYSWFVRNLEKIED